MIIFANKKECHELIKHENVMSLKYKKSVNIRW